MSVRAARFGDYWRKAFLRNYKSRYTSLEFSGINALHDAVINFSSGITAVVGGNGVGKTTLAHAIVEAISGETGIPSLRNKSHRLDGATLTATVSNDSGETAQKRSLSITEDQRQVTGGLEVPYLWLDASTNATLCQEQILGDDAFNEILESLAPKVLNQEQRELACYLVGKAFSICEVWEIQDYGPFEVWPYFRVVCNGVTYGSESMGQGELALLTTLWAIDRAPKDSIVVLEEPETHVSARSQSALMDLLAWACVMRGLWIVLTTHSPVILARLPQDHIRLLVNEGGRSRLLPQPRMHDVATVVGGGTALKCLLLVEDECAKYFVQSLLEQLSFDLGRQFAIAMMDGEARIVQVLNTLPAVKGWSYIIGCFDGDARGKVDPSSFSWPHLFLPGSLAPELLFYATPEISEPAVLANELHIDAAAVSVALSSVIGLDHHDWLIGLQNNLARSKEELVRAMVRIWLRGQRAAAEAFIADLKASFS